MRSHDYVVEQFNDSLLRCLSQEGFLETFYTRFVAASDAIRAAFDRSDMARERPSLKAALFLCASAFRGDKQGAEALRAMGRRHRTYGVRPTDYETWLATLIAVASEYDSRFSSETAAAWETVMRGGIELMKEGHTAPSDT